METKLFSNKETLLDQWYHGKLLPASCCMLDAATKHSLTYYILVN